MRKFLFLDIDGVLNSDEWFKRDRDGLTGPYQRTINPECCRRVNRICAETGAKIVISSAWRIGTPFLELRKGLRSRGLNADIVGKTPYSNGVSNLYLGVPRGQEILAWCRSHLPVDSMVILDDDSDMAPLLGRLVRTDHRVGLTEDDADAAIRLLADDLSSIGYFQARIVTRVTMLSPALLSPWATTIFQTFTAIRAFSCSVSATRWRRSTAPRHISPTTLG